MGVAEGVGEADVSATGVRVDAPLRCRCSNITTMIKADKVRAKKTIVSMISILLFPEGSLDAVGIRGVSMGSSIQYR